MSVSEPVPMSELIPPTIRERMEAYNAMTDDEKARLDAEDERRRREQFAAEFASVGDRAVEERIPQRYRGGVVEHRVATWLRALFEGTDRGLLLAGQTGVGKTHLLHAVMEQLVRDNPVAYLRDARGHLPVEVDEIAWDELYKPKLSGRAQYWPAPLLLTQLRPGGMPVMDTIGSLSACPLLLLDDLGAHNSSEWVDEILFQLVDARYMHMRPTVFATNVPPNELAAVIGDRLVSRIAEMCDVVVLDGEDRRRGS